MLDYVTEDVRATTDGRQKPAVYRTAKEDTILFELHGFRPLPSIHKALLRDVVVPLCNVFTQQVPPYESAAFLRMRRRALLDRVKFFCR